jgi:hypothetical protein
VEVWRAVEVKDFAYSETARWEYPGHQLLA